MFTLKALKRFCSKVTQKSSIDGERGVFQVKNLYIHIPFCTKKCTFCDFSVYAVGKSKIKNSVHDTHSNEIYTKYIESLLGEIDFIYRNFPEKFGGKLDTIYFGGGTPSLIEPNFIKQILARVKTYQQVSENIEISFETDPATFDEEKLCYYMDLGVNRVTMGVQSLDENVLRGLNRSHTLNDTFKSIDILQSMKEKYVLNFGLDLIQGLPNQSVESALKDISYLSSQKVPHLSVYLLSLEKRSRLYSQYKNEYFSKNKQEQITDLFTETHNSLVKKGYTHYEISNYCLDNMMSIHNWMYWDSLKEYYGFGSSSASFFNKNRFKKPKSVSRYLEFVKGLNKESFNNYCQQNQDKEEFENDSEKLHIMNTDLNHLKYFLLNQVRKHTGIELERLESSFGSKIRSLIEKFFIEKSYNFVNMSEGLISLKFPQGVLVSDEVLVDLFIFLEKEMTDC